MFHRIKKRLASLALAFAAIAAPAAAKAQQTTPPTPAPIEGLWLWKEKDVNAVMEMKPCLSDTKKACMSIYWVHPTDSPKTFDAFGNRDSTRAKIPNADQEDFRNVTSEDVLNLCGYAPPLEGDYDGSAHWQGRITMRGRDNPLPGGKGPLKLDISLDKIASDTLKIRSTLIWHFGLGRKRVYDHSVNWVRVQPDDPTYPSCVKPPAPPQP